MKPSSRRLFLQLGALAGTGAAIRWQLDPTSGALFNISSALASAQVKQKAQPGNRITQFVTPLTTFDGKRVSGSSIAVTMVEFQQRVLPDAFYGGLAAPFVAGTYLRGYQVGARNTPSYPGTTVEVTKGSPLTVTYTNALPPDPVLRALLTIDQTIHWADPLHQMGSTAAYTGPMPMVVHLHGAEDSSSFDGAPEAWFTADGRHGAGYQSLSPTAANAAIYQYPNNQQATTLWFHDHALGITRVNVLSGLTAFYFIRDQFDTGLISNPLNLPAGDNHEVELMLQDRQFDTNGQLLFPDGSEPPAAVLNGGPPNPGVHPYWIPEFFGDVNVVNGRSWPFFKVEPRRYRFRIVNAANARMYRMKLVDSASGAAGPPIWQIGTDGGLLDRPVKLADGTSLPLFLAPAERADVIIDFTALAGKTFTLVNDANAPFPNGDPPDPATAGRVMQFQVTLKLVGRDNTYDPATGAPLRGGANQEPVIVRLANPATGTLGAGVTVNATRQLVLVEVEGPGGPIEVLLNNTKWRGIRDRAGNPPDTPVPGSVQDQFGQGIWMTELPRVGSTEVWEVLNLTEDAHPIHIHLIQFQVMNRQAVARDPTTGGLTYRPVYDSQFPGGTFAGLQKGGTWGLVTYPAGVFIPGYGPPNDYTTLNGNGALGGNPAFGSFLAGPIILPDANEAGWKDTLRMLPGQVTRVVARWAPQATAVNGVQPGQNLYTGFDPRVGPGYVWHCHILDHEDNEMMRPYLPVS